MKNKTHILCARKYDKNHLTASVTFASNQYRIIQTKNYQLIKLKIQLFIYKTVIDESDLRTLLYLSLSFCDPTSLIYFLSTKLSPKNHNPGKVIKCHVNEI